MDVITSGISFMITLRGKWIGREFYFFENAALMMETSFRLNSLWIRGSSVSCIQKRDWGENERI